MGYLMKEVETLKPEDATPYFREILLRLAQVIEDTESKVDNLPEDSDVPEESTS